MPFDNPLVQPKIRVRNKAEIALLDRTLEIIPDSRHWCKHALSNLSGTRLCLIGALQVADGRTPGSYQQPYTKAYHRVRDRLMVFAGGKMVEHFNDKPRTRYADVRRLILTAKASFE